MLPIIALGALAGTGLFLIVRELVPSQPRLDHALARLAPSNLTLTATTPTEAPRGRERLGAWIERTLAGRTGFTTPTRDLELLGRTARNWWADKALCALAGLLIPTLLIATAEVAALPIPLILPAGLALILAVAFWFLPDLQARTEATEARQEFARAAVAYLQLVAIQRAATGGTTDVMMSAAEVSDAWMFTRIRQHLTRAQWAHIPAWDGLAELGTTIAVPELEEVADIMRLAGEQDASVYETLLARSASLRGKLLSAEHTKATAATASMFVPAALLIAVLLAALAYPAILLILA